MTLTSDFQNSWSKLSSFWNLFLTFRKDSNLPFRSLHSLDIFISCQGTSLPWLIWVNRFPFLSVSLTTYLLIIQQGPFLLTFVKIWLVTPSFSISIYLKETCTEWRKVKKIKEKIKKGPRKTKSPETFENRTNAIKYSKTVWCLILPQMTIKR